MTYLLKSYFRNLEERCSSLVGMLKTCGQQFYDSKFDIKLSHIENPAVKSVLSAKLLEAQNKGIGISVEIDEPVRDLFIGFLDFITFLSILCDNAL